MKKILYVFYFLLLCLITRVEAFDFFKKHIDDALHGTVGEDFLRLFGYYDEESTSGCFRPDCHKDEKVRITWINGLFNLRKHVENNLAEFSDAHGGHTIYYVFYATGGWTEDILHSVRVKLNNHVSPVAQMLGKLWKKLIAEMGGPNGGGVIIHYAHSMGAMNTLMAKSLLTQEEQKMIHVITLGTPLMLSESAGFGSVTNYISRRDGVSLADPVGYIKAWVLDDMNVAWVGSSEGIPFVEHYLETDAYRGVVKRLGAEFVETYSYPRDPHSNMHFNYNH